MTDEQINIYLNQLDAEIDNCKTKIDEACRTQEKWINTKYGLITARDHFAKLVGKQ